MLSLFSTIDVDVVLRYHPCKGLRQGCKSGGKSEGGTSLLDVKAILDLLQRVIWRGAIDAVYWIRRESSMARELEEMCLSV